VTGVIPTAVTAAVVLIDLRRLEIEIDVDETDVAPIVVGQAATSV
jgi:multidrug resistance efflux pump